MPACNAFGIDRSNGSGMISLERVDPCVHGLLALLIDPRQAGSVGLADWDKIIRLARQSRLLGVLSYRIQSHPELLPQLPECVLGHLRSAAAYSAHRIQMLRIELAALAKALPAEIPVVVLKGAAYIVQNLEITCGRLPSDVDLMVAYSDLKRAEAALLDAGWSGEVIDAYDQRYYREWSHELPPMRRPGHSVELDLHHTITPVTARLKPDTALLFADLQVVEGERFLVLHPQDQILHAAVHLFQDSELFANLRDLVDIDRSGTPCGHAANKADLGVEIVLVGIDHPHAQKITRFGVEMIIDENQAIDFRRVGCRTGDRSLLVHLIDQDLDFTPDLRRQQLRRDIFLQLHQTLPALLANLLRHRTRQGIGRRAVNRRIGKQPTRSSAPRR
jgi:hypothetical protein